MWIADEFKHLSIFKGYSYKFQIKWRFHNDLCNLFKCDFYRVEICLLIHFQKARVLVQSSAVLPPKLEFKVSLTRQYFWDHLCKDYVWHVWEPKVNCFQVHPPSWSLSSFFQLKSIIVGMNFLFPLKLKIPQKKKKTLNSEPKKFDHAVTN